MVRFWASVVEPILTRLGPKVVVEIGSDRAENTRHLAEFCRRHGAVLHAIDPSPGFDVAAYASQYGGHFVFHQETSLAALPRVGAMDAVLIDGDHNWHTVYSELKLVEELSAEHGHAFPVVLLHDVDWPYGRRDLYYDPAQIPESCRKPYQRAGVVRHAQALRVAGGLNAHMNNATCEGDARNGVLTAIEDFLNGTPQALTFTMVPGFHGLGVLVPSALLAENAPLAEFVQRLETQFAGATLIRRMEQGRLALEIAAQKWGREKDRYGRAQNAAPGKMAATVARWAARGGERVLDRLIAAAQTGR